jgi:hypothetical protein
MTEYKMIMTHFGFSRGSRFFTGTKSGGIKPIVIYILFEKIIILLLFIEGWG